MVTSRAPVVALEAMVMVAFTSVTLTKLVEVTVMPVPEKVAARPAPLSKLVPLIAISWLVAP